MSILNKFFSEGLQNTLLLNNNAGLSHKGPWILAYPDTVLDRWYIGDFSAAEYTISCEFDSKNRDILKCLVVAGIDNANLNVYSRCATNIDLIDIHAVKNNSFVDILINPKTERLKDTKVIYTANYFESQNYLEL
jgi:4-alpha-glucanotransferase